MKVVYASAVNPLETGGPHNTVEVWLERLSERGLDVDVVTRTEDEVTGEIGDVSYYGYPGIRPAEKVKERLRKLDADVVLTESGWADVAIEAANELGIASVLNVVAILGRHKRWEGNQRPTKLTACSQYAKQWVAEVWNREATVSYPTIDFEYYTLEDQTRESVGMVTPIEVKGGRVFRQMAEEMPQRSFVTNRGWHALRNPDLSWDEEMLLLAAKTWSNDPESATIEDYEMPTDVDMSGVENVEYVDRRAILDLYRRARVVVEPYQWQQAFSRVALEAMWNGIPVVSPNRGGISEATGGAGLLVEDHRDPEAWMEKLRVLDDPDRYEVFSRMARERAEEFRRNQPTQIDNLVETIEAAYAET